MIRALTRSPLPKVLLMDEAFSALDPLIRSEMQGELVKLQRQDKRTIIFISHDIEEAFRIGDRIAIMEGGVVVQVGSDGQACGTCHFSAGVHARITNTVNPGRNGLFDTGACMGSTETAPARTSGASRSASAANV